MAVLSVSNLDLAFGDRVVLRQVNMTLAAGEHVGLVGRNGCGKTTLLKLIAGLDHLKPDSGQVQVQREATVGYLTQDPVLNPDHTLWQEAATAFAALDHIQGQIDQLTDKMANTQGPELDRLLKRYEKLEHDMHQAGGYAVDHQIDATLHGLGLSDEFFPIKVSDLSGGQQGRLALAKLLLSQPDMLLLDEPTNHLDIVGRQWLEDFLRGYRGAVILVSHDRWLLDHVVKRIYELENSTSFEYPGNYHAYRKQRAQRKLTEQRIYEKQQDEVRRQRGYIDRYKTGQRAKQARGREKRLERYIDQEMIDRPYEEATVNIQIKPMARSGDIVINAQGVTKGYDGKPLFGDLDVVIARGDRVGVIGPNGAGKSTLVRCLLDEQPLDRGNVRVGSQVDVGHYRQTHEHLDLSLTVVDYLRRFVVDGTEQAARGLAGAFLFRDDEQDQPLATLSGGERSRAVLAGLIVSGHNLLILDEPTNHLDVQSAEQLEQALQTFSGKSRKGAEGTLIVITHDRMLLDDVVDQLVVLDGEGNAQHFLGTYSEYLASISAEAAPVATPDKPKPTRPAPKTKAAGGALTKLSQKALEQKIEKIETTIADMDRQLADPEVYRDGEKMRALSKKREACLAELTPLEEEWTRRAEAV